jgi:hypothetical protein
MDFRAIRDELQQHVSILSTVCPVKIKYGVVQHPVNNMSTTASGGTTPQAANNW